LKALKKRVNGVEGSSETYSKVASLADLALLFFLRSDEDKDEEEEEEEQE
jgi:hypothetical protein